MPKTSLGLDAKGLNPSFLEIHCFHLDLALFIWPVLKDKPLWEVTLDVGKEGKDGKTQRILLAAPCFPFIQMQNPVLREV